MPRARSACIRCALPLSRTETCGRCIALAPRFDDARAAFEYRFPMDRLVQRFKYAGDLAVGRWLAERLFEAVSESPRPQLIVSPPSTRERLRERGFNPALEIAKRVARQAGVPCAIGGLARSRPTTPQPGLGRAAREANVMGALRCDTDVQGLHVALVDDVMTTGATANAAASVLKQAGAARVSAWLVARTP
jgi:ComF family protein